MIMAVAVHAHDSSKRSLPGPTLALCAMSDARRRARHVSASWLFDWPLVGRFRVREMRMARCTWNMAVVLPRHACICWTRSQIRNS